MHEQIKVFISYAPEDEAARQDLENNLAMLQQSGAIRVAHRRHVALGRDYNAEMERLVDQARLILLLVSTSYLANDLCAMEMRQALSQHRAGRSHVIPIILDPCDWEGAEFQHLLMLPEEGKPVSHASWGTRARAWTHVVLRLRDAIEALQTGKEPMPIRGGRSFVSSPRLSVNPVSQPAVSRRSTTAVAALSAAEPRLRQRGLWPLIVGVGVLFCALVAGATWALDAMRTPPPGQSSSVAPWRPSPVVAAPPTLPAVGACPAPCCGGLACAAADQDTAGTICASIKGLCAACRSGRPCVTDACSTALGLRRTFQLRLARVDVGGLAPGAQVCVRHAGSSPSEAMCTSVTDAADLPGVDPASGMRTRLSVMPADLIAPSGLDIEIYAGGRPVAAHYRAVLKGSNVLTSALCVGVSFDVDAGRVSFYLDD